MSIIGKFEEAMQGLIEGSFGRIFRTRLQPVEVARRLERAMEGNLTLTADRRVAPNLYLVHLSVSDYAQFNPYARSLAQQLADSLITVARERHYMLSSRPVVRFIEDPRIITGQLHIDAQMLDSQLAGEEGVTPGGMVAVVEETRALNADERKELDREIGQVATVPSAVPSIPPAWLTRLRPTREQPRRLDHPAMHIGRNQSNDIIVDDRRASRYHAEIRYEHGQFVLYDLGSINGVRVNGAPMRQPVPLRDNDLISIGSHEFIFQRR